MSKEEIEIEKPDKTLKIAEKIPDFNKKIQKKKKKNSTWLKNINTRPNV